MNKIMYGWLFSSHFSSACKKSWESIFTQVYIYINYIMAEGKMLKPKEV